eukprot:Opistho-2@35989
MSNKWINSTTAAALFQSALASHAVQTALAEGIVSPLRAEIAGLRSELTESLKEMLAVEMDKLHTLHPPVATEAVEAPQATPATLSRDENTASDVARTSPSDDARIAALLEAMEARLAAMESKIDAGIAMTNSLSASLANPVSRAGASAADSMQGSATAPYATELSEGGQVLELSAKDASSCDVSESVTLATNTPPDVASMATWSVESVQAWAASLAIPRSQRDILRNELIDGAYLVLHAIDTRLAQLGVKAGPRAKILAGVKEAVGVDWDASRDGIIVAIDRDVGAGGVNADGVVVAVGADSRGKEMELKLTEERREVDESEEKDVDRERERKEKEER